MGVLSKTHRFHTSLEAVIGIILAPDVVGSGDHISPLEQCGSHVLLSAGVEQVIDTSHQHSRWGPLSPPWLVLSSLTCPLMTVLASTRLYRLANNYAARQRLVFELLALSTLFFADTVIIS